VCTFFDYGNHRGGTDTTVSVQPWHTNFKAQLDLSSLDRDVQFYFERGLGLVIAPIGQVSTDLSNSAQHIIYKLHYLYHNLCYVIISLS